VDAAPGASAQGSSAESPVDPKKPGS
jgi:hypothetical protein